MKNIRWLLELADGKPLMFALALLLIGVSTLSGIVINRDNKINSCQKEKAAIERYYMTKIDSINALNDRNQSTLNEEVKQTLSSIIEDYKSQLKEQKILHNEISTTIRKNKTFIKQTIKRGK